MALIDDVKAVCDRLDKLGWRDLLLEVTRDELDIRQTAPDELRQALQKPLSSIDRSVPGFEDFSSEGRRGIEPGSPRRSLLYHALASPNVVHLKGRDIAGFPTLRELGAVENYVFGVRPPSLAELNALANGDMMAIAVFATEYRPGADSVLRKHAELCFSRTGVARVGNASPAYDTSSRGFIPFVDDEATAFRVLPVRYSAWIAVQRAGSETAFGPMRFSFRARHPDLFRRSNDPAEPDDTSRKFWVPLHKLFSGNECIQGLTLLLDLKAHHVNEKLRRLHLELARRGINAGWSKPEIDRPPFRFTTDIAEFSSDADLGHGLLVPVPHDPLVQPARLNDRPVTFRVPEAATLGSRTTFLPTLEVTAENGRRRAPEYVHVRHALNEPKNDLNDLADPATRVSKGDYQAIHYLDFTGDGWIEAVCPELKPQFPRFIAAYSLVTAPDFFFKCSQREVMDWWLQRAPEALRNFLWETPPFCLSDERLAPNLKLNNDDFQSGNLSVPKAGFRQEDDTVTTIISLPSQGAVQGRPLVEPRRNRHNALPDGASGVFAPGWDASWDTTGNVRHLTSYGLGSPFPEDSKLCAALSTFWPSVAPDAGRSFSQTFPTVCPLTDDEIGQNGTPSWDGTSGPRVTKINGREIAEYDSFEHVDYVTNALGNRFSLLRTSEIDTQEYVSRVLAMARAYQAVGVSVDGGDKASWNVLSFRRANSADAERNAAEKAGGEALEGNVYRFELYQPGGAPVQPADFRKRHIRITNRRTIFIGGSPVVLMRTGNVWQAVHV